MGAHSSLHITRRRATEFYVKHVLKIEISDEELERALDKHLDAQLYNAVIVSDHYENNDDGMLPS